MSKSSTLGVADSYELVPPQSGLLLHSLEFRGFEGASIQLTGCRLAGAWLNGAHCFGARYNAATRWPPGFDPAEHGCAYENDAEQDLPLPSAPEAGDASVLPLVALAPRDELPTVQVAGWERRG